MTRSVSWNDFPAVSQPDLKEWVEVPDNGYQLCCLWAAGPDNGCRVSVPTGSESVLETRVSGDGTRTVTRRPPSPEVEQDLSETVNTYLAEAGIPPRPGHHRWFLKRPSWLDVADDFNAVTKAIAAHKGTADDAATVLQAAESVVK